MIKKGDIKQIAIFCRFISDLITVYNQYFDDIIKFEDFDLDNILIDEKSYEIILLLGLMK